MKNKWRLPNGEYTSSGKKMAKAWENIYKPICQATGSTVIGFDPDILFKYSSYKSFNIPVSIAEQMAQMIKALKLVIKEGEILLKYDTIEACIKAITPPSKRKPVKMDVNKDVWNYKPVKRSEIKA